MASNGADVWIPPEVEWNKRRIITFALLGSFVIFLTFKGWFVDELIVRSVILLSVLLAVFRTFPGRWPRLLMGLAIFIIFAAFEQVFIDILALRSFVLLVVFLTVAYTFPDDWHRFSTALSIVIALSLFFAVNIYDFISENLDLGENRLLRLFLEGQVERAVFSGLAGLAGGLLTVGALLLLFMFPSSEFILALHEIADVNRWDALRWLWSLIMGIQYPWQIVEDGKVTVTKPKGVFGEIGGPGVVVVRPGNAVVFEWGGEVTRIEGPGVHKTKRFERIKDAVDLLSQWSTVRVENVLTKDRVPLVFEVGVGYQIEPKQDTDRRIEKAESEGKEFEWKFEKGEEVIEGICPVYKDSVFRAVYQVSGARWYVIVQGITGAFFRDAVIAYTLDQLYEPSEAAEGELKESPSVIAEIEDRVLQRLKEVAINLGVKIGAFDITSVEMPPEVKEQVLKWWGAEWRKEIVLKEAEGALGAMMMVGGAEAEVIRGVEKVKADARERVLGQLAKIVNKGGKPPSDDVIMRYLDVLEKLSTRLVADDVTALRYIEALEKLSESEGARLIIAPPGSDLLVNTGEKKS